MREHKEYVTVLTIAGSDGSGGAGIQADLKTITALGCYGLSVITAITAQNTRGVIAVHPLPPDFIRKQFDALHQDIRIDAVKIGMLGSRAALETVSELLECLHGIPIVLDTVLHSTSGSALFPEEDVSLLKRLLFPKVALVTPNLLEAARLTSSGFKPPTEEKIERAAELIHLDGAAAVLVKGGHWEGVTCRDCLLHEGNIHWFRSSRIETENSHGTGCTLSAAIASGLGCGMGMKAAVETGIAYTRTALHAGVSWRLGHGSGPLQHFPDNYFVQRGSRPIE